MAIRPDDEEKMRRVLGLPDAMTKSTGSDIDPEKAAELRHRAEVAEEVEKAESDDWERQEPRPASGS